jgi:hypothetical protein
MSIEAKIALSGDTLHHCGSAHAIHREKTSARNPPAPSLPASESIATADGYNLPPIDIGE